MLLDEYARRILDECYVDYYLSSSYDGGRIEWPWRMFPPTETYPRYVDLADEFIVDSEFNDQSVTNTNVLDKAVEVGATKAVLEDVYQDFTGTVDRVLAGLEKADEHEFDGDIICPLQAPFVQCYRELGEPDAIAIGGLKDARESRKVEAAQQLRRFAGDDVYIHGLGWGASETLVSAIRNHPDLLNSIDARTEGVEANSMDIWPGEERSTPLAVFTLARLLEKCRRMSPIPNEPASDGQNEDIMQYVQQQS